MKRHYWQYIIDNTGIPFSGVYVHVFLTDLVSRSSLEASGITGNILTDIDESIYAYLGTSVSQLVDNYNITKITPVITTIKGFFEFWISDIEDNKTDYRYEYDQKFTLVFVKAGSVLDIIENVDIFGIHYEVDETDTSSVLKNKSISNKITAQIEAHRTSTYLSEPHGFKQVNPSALITETDYTTKNKLTSNELEAGQQQHIAKTYTQTPHNIGVVDITALPAQADYTTKNKLTSNELTINAKNHIDAVYGVHGVSGQIVGTSDTQTLTNKTIKDLVVESTEETSVGYNKKITSLYNNDNDFEIVSMTSVWNGSSFDDTTGIGIGKLSLDKNTGTSPCAFGIQSLEENTGNGCSGFGVDSLRENTGDWCSGFGVDSLKENTGDYCSGFGTTSLYFNTGTFSSGFGMNSLLNNQGSSCIGIGFSSLYDNTGDDCIGIGHNALEYSENDDNIAIGNMSNSTFIPNTSGDKTFDFGDVDINTNRITISSHGFGANDSYVNLSFTEGTSGITGLDNNTVYKFKIITDSIIELSEGPWYDITDVGNGTGHTLTPQYKYENTICIGNNTVPSASNQITLGNDSTTTTLLKGNIGINTSTFGASAANVIAILNGTAPSDSPANSVQLYAEDVTASSELKVRDEAGNITTLSPHNFTLFSPADDYIFPWSYYSRNNYIGKEINVDMYGAIAEIEKLSGKTFIYVNDVPKEDWELNQLRIKEENDAKITEANNRILVLEQQLNMITKKLLEMEPLIDSGILSKEEELKNENIIKETELTFKEKESIEKTLSSVTEFVETPYEIKPVPTWIKKIIDKEKEKNK